MQPCKIWALLCEVWPHFRIKKVNRNLKNKEGIFDVHYTLEKKRSQMRDYLLPENRRYLSGNRVKNITKRPHSLRKTIYYHWSKPYQLFHYVRFLLLVQLMVVSNFGTDMREEDNFILKQRVTVAVNIITLKFKLYGE